MKVFAAAVQGTGAERGGGHRGRSWTPTQFDFVEKDGTFNERLEVTYSAVDVNGKVFPGDRHTVNLAMKPDTFERVKARGIRVLSQIDLPPGRYQLRVAAGNAGGKVGSVLYDLDVPDFYKAPLTMSGVALTSASAAQVVTIKPKDPLADVLPGPADHRAGVRARRRAARCSRSSTRTRGTRRRTCSTSARSCAPRADASSRQSVDERSSTELDTGTGGYGFKARTAARGRRARVLRASTSKDACATSATAAVSRDIQIRVR